MSIVLPDELVLAVCKQVSHEDLWLSMRNVNRQFRRCAEDVMRRVISDRMTIGLNFSIGIGIKHRWYDIRASITFGCNNISNEEAFFGQPTFLPESCSDRAMEKWKAILDGGIDKEQAWKMSLAGNDVRYAHLPSLEMAQYGAIRLDWRELLNAFFRKTISSEQYWAKQWQAV